MEMQIKPINSAISTPPINPADHLGLVRRCVGRSPRYRSRLSKLAAANRHEAIEDSEEYAEGCVGLMHAVEGYDPLRGVRFSTYATWCIDNAILAIGKRERAAKRDVSLEQFESECNRDEDGRTPLDYIPARGVNNPVDLLILGEHDDATKRMVRRLLRRLAPRNRKMIELYYLNGLEPKEVGKRIEPPITGNCVRVMVSRAMRIMREFAQSKGIEP